MTDKRRQCVNVLFISNVSKFSKRILMLKQFSMRIKKCWWKVIKRSIWRYVVAILTLIRVAKSKHNSAALIKLKGQFIQKNQNYVIIYSPCIFSGLHSLPLYLFPHCGSQWLPSTVGYQHSSKYLLSCSAEERHEGLTKLTEWQMFIFGWTVSLTSCEQAAVWKNDDLYSL